VEGPLVPAHPYLLSRTQIEAFFAAAACLDASSPWQWQAVAFFTLMHSCGLRTGETRLLATEHVHLRDHDVDIVSSKGNRSRRLPLTGPVADVLAGCDRESRKRFGPARRTFFVSTTGNEVTAATVGKIFNRIWDQAGLLRPAGGQQPRPYDFRHHFAYANVERWAAHGSNVTAMLPLPRPLHGAREYRVELLLHPHLAGLHGRLRRHHHHEPIATARGRIGTGAVTCGPVNTR
jgi:integrase